MGLFNFGKKKQETVKDFANAEVKKVKEKSHMLAIPKHPEQLTDVMQIVERLKNAKDFTMLQMGMREDRVPWHEIEYMGEKYEFVIYPEHYKIPELFRVQHFFEDVDVKEIDKQETGLVIAMDFSDKFLESYHLQLKIIHTIFPEVLAVIDYGAEKILSGTWLAYAAEGKTPPAPRYLFTAQAVYDKNEVWLHTHGLNRCGLMELEVIGSTKESSNNHYRVLESMASRLIDEPDSLDDGGPIYLARFVNGQPLMVTWVPWQQAMGLVNKKSLGGPADRTDECGHNGYTGCVYTYQSPADMENKRYSHISVYDELLENNPMFMFTNQETDRLRTLAIERVDYMKKAFLGGAKGVLIKVGLKIDEEHRTDTNEREHIWFELKSVQEDTFTAVLTQEPYMVSGMHEGDEGTYPYTDITDWIVFTEKDRISPDDIYLLDK